MTVRNPNGQMPLICQYVLTKTNNMFFFTISICKIPKKNSIFAAETRSLSPDDPFKKTIPTYAIGWDGIRRGNPVVIDGGIMLDDVVISCTRIK